MSVSIGPAAAMLDAVKVIARDRSGWRGSSTGDGQAARKTRHCLAQLGRGRAISRCYRVRYYDSKEIISDISLSPNISMPIIYSLEAIARCDIVPRGRAVTCASVDQTSNQLARSGYYNVPSLATIENDLRMWIPIPGRLSCDEPERFQAIEIAAIFTCDVRILI